MRNDILIGCDYNQLNLHTPVLNISSLGNSLHVKIPQAYCKYQLISIYDISGKEPREVNFFGLITQDYNHPWIDIPLSILSLRSGKHIYRLDFYDSITDTVNATFISYVSQDDNPETSYIYMKNRGNADSSANTWKDGSYADEFYEQLREEVEETYGYDPLLFGESEGNYYCSMCALPTCDNCPYKEA